jgi:hypothetical protein
MGTSRLAERTDRPVRGDPFAGRMLQRCGQPDQAGGVIDRGRLDGGNLVPAQGLTHEV